jgi:hypothetical protein
MLILDRKTVLEGRTEVAAQTMGWGKIAGLMGLISEDLVAQDEISKRRVTLAGILESMVVRVMDV